MFRAEHTVIAPSWRESLRAHDLDTVAGAYRCAAGQAVTNSGSTQVRRIQLSGTDGQTRVVFLKKYWYATAGERWSGMLRGTFFGRSKARREFDNLARLRAWGLDAPMPVACGEERAARWLVRSFLLTEGVPDALPLHAYLRRILPALAPAERRARRREVIEQLARATQRLHEHGFGHGDLFWRNIILSGHGLEKFWLIDAHKGRCWSPWGAVRARAADLAALDAPAPWFLRRSERLRFFLLYRGHPSLTPEDKSLLRRTLRLAAPMREAQLRRAGGVPPP